LNVAYADTVCVSAALPPLLTVCALLRAAVLGGVPVLEAACAQPRTLRGAVGGGVPTLAYTGAVLRGKRQRAEATTMRGAQEPLLTNNAGLLFP
jgi:hypothetical protein